MKGYKAFNPGMICKDKQYEENSIATEEKAVPCACGIHFCKNPFDVLEYYPLVDKDGNFSEFAEVESIDEPVTEDGKKFCTTKLKVGVKLSFAGFIKACIEYIKESTVQDSSSEDSAKIASSGDFAQIASSGDFAKIASSGGSAQIGSSGDSAKIASSGDFAQIGSSGDCAKIASSGDFAQIGSSGYSARIASSGGSAQIGSSGYSARIASSGGSARIASTGEDGVIMCAGIESVARAKKGSWITLSEWNYDESKNRCVPICVKTERVDGDRIKEDVFYELKNGEFVEISEVEEDDK